MCRVIAVSNQKGGVGKTTTSINLGVGLARMGQRVLLVDSDPQGHLTLGLGFPKNIRVTLKNMMENIIMGIEFDPKEAVLHHKEGVGVIVLKLQGLQNRFMKPKQGCLLRYLNMAVTTCTRGYADHIASHYLYPFSTPANRLLPPPEDLTALKVCCPLTQLS